MPFCAKCGKQIPENAKFCDGCGSPISAGPVFKENTDNSNNYNSNYNSNYNDYNGNNVNAGYGTSRGMYTNERRNGSLIVNRIRETGGSTLQLVLIICMAAGLVFSFINGSGSFLGMGAGLGGGMMVFILIGNIPTILTVIGLLLFYLECKSSPSPIGKGLGVYKAAKIIMIIYIAIIGVILIIGMFFGGAVLSGLGGLFGGALDGLLQEAGGSYSYGYGYGEAAASIFTGVMIVVIIIVVAVLVLAILFEAKLMKSANIVRDSLAAGTRRGTIPVYPIVIEIIAAVFVVISLFSTIGTMLSYMSYFGGSYGGMVGMTVISSIIGVVTTIITIVMLFKIRSAVNQ